MTTPWTPEQAAADLAEDTISAVQKATAEPALPGLLSVDDPDWTAFQTDDPEWYLKAAGKTIRNYLGWHLYPNRRQTKHNMKVGSKGIIMLPSRHVTQVDSLFMQTGQHDDQRQFIHHHDYLVFKAGWIQLKGWSFHNDWFYSGYFYGSDQYFLTSNGPGIATCTFWSGYDTLPDEVKEVAFEMAEQSMTVRAGNVKMLEAPGGFKAQTSQPFGMTLNPDQMSRISSYRIGMVG